MPKLDRTKIAKGMFLTGGPSADRGETMVKVAPSVDELDAKFDAMQSVRDSLGRIQQSVESLKATRKP